MNPRYQCQWRAARQGGNLWAEGSECGLIGNITYMNSKPYTYGSAKPHAVTQVGPSGYSTSYAYDGNGNMTTRGNQTLTWDLENRLVTVTGNRTYYNDGDGKRVKEDDNGTVTVYINQFYEKNITASEVTTHYYLGGKQIAVSVNSTVNYILQDQVGSTSVTASASGDITSTVRYFAFGDRRYDSGTIPTDKQFTGQRLDSTGLYYYGARYYDATIGRFISADTIVGNPMNPQAWNRYSYVLNNPLRYVDPSGNIVQFAPSDTIINPSDPYIQWLNEYQYMANAWQSLSGYEPAATSFLIESQQTITIQWDYEMRSSGSTGPTDEGRGLDGNITISLNSNLMGADLLVPTLGHETFHAVIDNKMFLAGQAGEADVTNWPQQVKSFANEILAFSFEYRIGEKMGLSWDPSADAHKSPIASKDTSPFNLDNSMVTKLVKGPLEYYGDIGYRENWPNYGYTRPGNGCTGPGWDIAKSSQRFLRDAASIW